MSVETVIIEGKPTILVVLAIPLFHFCSCNVTWKRCVDQRGMYGVPKIPVFNVFTVSDERTYMDSEEIHQLMKCKRSICVKDELDWPVGA